MHPDADRYWLFRLLVAELFNDTLGISFIYSFVRLFVGLTAWSIR